MHVYIYLDLSLQTGIKYRFLNFPIYLHCKIMISTKILYFGPKINFVICSLDRPRWSVADYHYILCRHRYDVRDDSVGAF